MLMLHGSLIRSTFFLKKNVIKVTNTDAEPIHVDHYDPEALRAIYRKTKTKNEFMKHRWDKTYFQI